MTVAANPTVTAEYIGDGTATEWLFPFPVFDNVDIYVDGVEVPYVQNLMPKTDLSSRPLRRTGPSFSPAAGRLLPRTRIS